MHQLFNEDSVSKIIKEYLTFELEYSMLSNDVVHVIGVILVAVVVLFYGDMFTCEMHLQSKLMSSSSVMGLINSTISDHQNSGVTHKYLLSNSGTHSYPYLAGFLTFGCLLACFLVICLLGPKAGR